MEEKEAFLDMYKCSMSLLLGQVPNRPIYMIGFDMVGEIHIVT